MSNSIPTTLPRRKRRWLRWLVGLGAVFAVAILAAYLILTSSAFFKGVILPHVSTALNASVTVSDAAIHPFSGVRLRDLKVQPNGAEPLITASEVSARYHLWDILRGNLRVDEVTLVSPTIELAENPDGSKNFDPILKALQQKPAPGKEEKAVPSAAPARPSKPFQIHLAKLTLEHATILQIKKYAGGQRDVTELTNVNLTLSNLINGGTARLNLAADIHMQKNPPSGTNATLSASLKCVFDCALNADLKPASVHGSANFTVAEAGGALADFNAFSAALNCDMTPTDIKQLAMQFQQANTPLGELAVSGPFDAEKMEGKLDVAVRGIDRRLLNLFGRKNGVDFGSTAINARAELQLANAGKNLDVTGRFNAEKMQLTRTGQTTPTLDLSANCDVALDRAARTATVRALNLAGTQNGAPLLTAQLTSPMSLALGGAGGAGEAAFDLVVTNLNLADWKPFLGDAASAGLVGLTLNVVSHESGKNISFDLDGGISQLAARVGGNEISQATVTLSAHGQQKQFKQVTLENFKAQVVLQNQPALTASGSGNYDLAGGDAEFHLQLQAAMTRLLAACPLPNVSVSSGDLDVNAHVVQKQKTQTVDGNLVLTGFTGKVGKTEMSNFGSKLDFEVMHSPEQTQIRKLAGSFSQNGNAGGDVDLSANYRPAQTNGDFKIKIAGVNQYALQPFLQPLLAGKQLVSVAVGGEASGQFNPQSGAFLADVQISNLAVSDPQKKFPVTPLAAGLKADVALAKQTADVRQLQITLTPTERAANQFQLTGFAAFSNTNAIQGSFTISAEALDLTRYYDLITGGNNAASKTKTTEAVAAPPVTPGAGGNQEPAAVHLPLQDFTISADIGRLYLRTMAATNLHATAWINGSHVLLKPCHLALNGAPVDATADLDLGMPGYKYKLTFNAKSVPLAPLVEAFAPGRAGEMGGEFTSSAQIAGAGVTGAGLQKNLAGQLDFAVTNLNLSMANVRSPVLRTLINVVAMVPQLLSSPEDAVATLLGGVLGRDTLMNDLKESPIQIISVNATAEGGKINLRSATVQSAAFKAVASGDITLNAVLTNSTIKIPVSVALSRSIAERLKVATTTNAYAPLPQFFTEGGTLGKPKPEINKLALAGAAIRSVGNSLLNPTNAAPIGDLLNQFLKPRK